MHEIGNLHRQIDELKKEVERLENMQQHYITTQSSSFKSNDIKDTDTVIFEILQNLLIKSGGDRAYIFEIDWNKRTHSCNFEVVKGQITPQEENLKGMSVDDTPWWIDRIENDLPIIIDDTNHMPEKSGCVGDVLRSQGIKSLIVSPLKSENGVWGYIGIDMVDHHRTWDSSSVEWFVSIADIVSICTELKLSEVLARKEKDHIKSLHENMPIGLLTLKLIYNSRGEIIDYLHKEANPAVCTILNSNIENIVGKYASELNVGLFEDYFELFLELSKTGKVISSIKSIEDKCYNYTLYSTEPDEIIVLFQDYTDFTKAGKALFQSEETMRNIFTNIPVGIEIYDKNGLLININDHEQSMFGFNNKKSIMGLSLFTNPLLPTDKINQLRVGEPVEFNLVYDFRTVKNNDYYDTTFEGKKNILVKGAVIRDINNNIENYMLIVIDNTESTMTLNKLKQFESMFNSIATVSEIGIFQWHDDPHTLFGTPQWFNNLGVDENQVKTIREAHSLVHEEDKERLAYNIKEMHDGNLMRFSDEIRVKNGAEWRWLKCNYKAEEYDLNDGITQIVGLNMDITELKNTELKLIEAKAKAEESDRLKSAFVANMSHEIRTPLNAILGFSELLIDAESIEEKQQYISIVRQNNDLLLQLISDILDISKIESGIIETSIDSVELNALCEEIVIAQSVKVTEPVELVFDRKIDHCVIQSDRNRLNQIISNLVGNAIKFTPSGTINIGYHVENNLIKFYVKDSGLGIETDQATNIFTRFVKLNSFIHGTGLGLPICRSLVEKLGGKIWVESQLGVGSCFWFTVPHEEQTTKTVVECNRESQTSKTLVPQPEANQPLILIAEDTDSNYLLVSTILKKYFRLARAYNGKEAVEMFLSMKPDLILMDMQMPIMGGLEATACITKHGTKTPIIALTAFAFDSDKFAALNAGCCEFVTKPVNPEALRNIIRKHLP